MRTSIQLLTSFALLYGLLGSTPAKELPVDKPEAVGLSSAKLGQIASSIRSTCAIPDFMCPLRITNKDRFAATHSRNEDGKLIVIDAPATSQFRGRPRFLSGGGGLVSTARDYARFCQMLLDGGQLHGRRILREETVAIMTKNQLPDSAVPITITERREGVGFGLGFSVRVAASDTEPAGRVGEYGWGGLASTHFWISPKDDLFVIALRQFMPYQTTLEERLKPIVYDAIKD